MKILKPQQTSWVNHVFPCGYCSCDTLLEEKDNVTTFRDIDDVVLYKWRCPGCLAEVVSHPSEGIHINDYDPHR